MAALLFVGQPEAGELEFTPSIAVSQSYTDNIDLKGGGTYVYEICEAGTTTCSNTIITVVF